MNKVNVVLVNAAPAIGKPEMLTGIRTREAAMAWGEKRGYTTVYFWQQRERVFADRLTKAVNVLAKQVETKSDHLRQMAEGSLLFAPSEKGNGLIEFLFGTALVLLVLLALGSCGKPW